MVGNTAALLDNGFPHPIKILLVLFVTLVLLLEEHRHVLDELHHAVDGRHVAFPSADNVSAFIEEFDRILALV